MHPPPSTLVLADWSARLGQDLFYPPNVAGWPGGRSWLSARACVVGRANYAAAVASGQGIGAAPSRSTPSAWSNVTAAGATGPLRSPSSPSC